MNAILNCLERNRRALQLERHGFTPQMEFVWKTPRFHASRHVVALMMPQGTVEPILVAKVARLPGDGTGVEREAQALADIHNRGARMGGTVPRLVGIVDCHGHPALVQTALRGKTIDPSTIRRDLEKTSADVAAWIIKLHRSTAIEADQFGSWFESHVVKPLRVLESALGDHDVDRRLLESASEQLDTLRDEPLPYVVEHGDLSHPNLFRLHSGEIGVIDWELADIYGVPFVDLCFFLTYAACAAQGARSPQAQLRAFDSAFFGDAAWARFPMENYVREMQIPRPAIRPLFLLTWTRYLAGLAQRLSCTGSSAWLRGNRYYAYWKHAIENGERFLKSS